MVTNASAHHHIRPTFLKTASLRDRIKCWVIFIQYEGQARWLEARDCPPPRLVFPLHFTSPSSGQRINFLFSFYLFYSLFLLCFGTLSTVSSFLSCLYSFFRSGALDSEISFRERGV